MVAVRRLYIDGESNIHDWSMGFVSVCATIYDTG